MRARMCPARPCSCRSLPMHSPFAHQSQVALLEDIGVGGPRSGRPVDDDLAVDEDDHPVRQRGHLRTAGGWTATRCARLPRSAAGPRATTGLHRRPSRCAVRPVPARRARRSVPPPGPAAGACPRTALRSAHPRARPSLTAVPAGPSLVSARSPSRPVAVALRLCVPGIRVDVEHRTEHPPGNRWSAAAAPPTPTRPDVAIRARQSRAAPSSSSAVGAEQCGDLAGAAVNETSRSTGTPPLCLTADSTVTAVPTAPAVPTGTNRVAHRASGHARPHRWTRTGCAHPGGPATKRSAVPGVADDLACQATKQTACGVDAHRCKIGVSCRAVMSGGQQLLSGTDRGAAGSPRGRRRERPAPSR